MSIPFDHRDPGTAETTWRSRAPWEGAPALSLDVDRVVVVAAHPDDETLGAGGLVATAHARDIPVTVLVLTDGTASHPESDSIATVRRAECASAVGALGGPPLRFAGLPDGELREHRRQVRDALSAVLAEVADARTLLAVPWWGDGHRDHRVVGETATRLSGARVRVVGYPIWMWHWGDPADVDTATWRVLRLGSPAVSAKDAAIRWYRSQLSGAAPHEAPMLHAGMLAHFARTVEVFVVPTDSTAKRTHPAEWFESFHMRHADPWGFDSRWYEQRKREMLIASLPRSAYRHAVELGCATGHVTALLAERAERVTAVDVSAVALDRARQRVPERGVAFRRLDLPQEWLEGTSDLVVLSELGYYWTPDELARAVTRIHTTLSRDGHLVACHWRRPIAGCVLDGDDVHAGIRASGLFRRIVSHIEDDFVLEVFAPRAPDETTDDGEDGR